MNLQYRALALPLAALIVLEAYARILGQESETIVPATQAAKDLWLTAQDGTLLRATGFTLLSAAVGLLIGGVAGVLAGIVLGLSKGISHAMSLTVELLRPLPSIALVPLATLIFGLGLKMEILVVAFATFWPMLVMTQSAIRQVDGRLLEVARMLRFGFLQRVWKFVVPSIVPRLFVALRVGAGLALVVAVTVEVVGNTLGLGYGLVLSQQNMQPGITLGWLFWVGALGFSVNFGLAWIERRAVGKFLGRAR